MTWPEIHGASTHFPVALLMAAGLFEAGGWAFRKAEWRRVALWMLALGVVMAVPSLFAGYMTMRTVFDGAPWPPILKEHVASVATAVVMGVLALWRHAKSGDAARIEVLILTVAAALAVAAAGYFGGKMALT